MELDSLVYSQCDVVCGPGWQWLSGNLKVNKANKSIIDFETMPTCCIALVAISGTGVYCSMYQSAISGAIFPVVSI